MKINLIKYIYIVVFLSITFMFLGVSVVNASFVLFSPSDRNVGLYEEFYIDLMLDPEGVSVNGIEGNINFPTEYISFVRAEEGKSMISLWVESPELVDNEVVFSGIIPNGFDGVIDPFNQNRKLPGLMTRLVFRAIKSGNISINTREINISLNNGFGTIERVPPISINVNINDKVNNLIYKNKSDTKPELEAYVVIDHNIYKNKFTLIYNALDRSSGIKEVQIKEGNKEWKSIRSPYLLEDQSRRSIIVLQAINYNDNIVYFKIDPLPNQFSFSDYIWLIILIIVLLLILFIKKYVYKNKK